jgi:hypothetical protein
MKKIILILLVLLGLQTQAQMNPFHCDSVELSISSMTATGWFVTVESNIHQLVANDSTAYATYSWTSCLMCGTNVGSDTTYNLSFFTDTTEMYSICYIHTICINNLCYACTSCDTLVWDNGNWNWMSMMMNNPTAIQEINPTENIDDNRLYDMLGKEIYAIPIGTPYIKNGKKYFKLKLNSK